MADIAAGIDRTLFPPLPKGAGPNRADGPPGVVTDGLGQPELRTGPAAELLDSLYRTAVPRGNDDLFYNMNLRRFQDKFCDRLEETTGTPDPPWYRFLQRQRAARAGRRLRRDIAMALAIHHDIAVRMQHASRHRNRPIERRERFTAEDNYYFRRAIRGYPRYGYMSPPTD